MTRYYNSISYTVSAPQYGRSTRAELSTALIRPYRLTERGAQRILRAETGYSDLIVHRVECSTYAR